jgi:3-deoxy-D-arabino-heptulosonate 7-phosphate (DAHP) synthase class II
MVQLVDENRILALDNAVPAFAPQCGRLTLIDRMGNEWESSFRYEAADFLVAMLNTVHVTGGIRAVHNGMLWVPVFTEDSDDTTEWTDMGQVAANATRFLKAQSVRISMAGLEPKAKEG